MSGVKAQEYIMNDILSPHDKGGFGSYVRESIDD